MYEIGLSINPALTDAEKCENIKKAGIDYVEISSSFIKDFNVIDFENTKKMLDNANLKVNSIHYPFIPCEELEISAFDKELRDFSVNYYIETIKKLSFLGAKYYVIHPSGEPIKDETRQEKLKCAQEGLARLAEGAAKEGAVIAIEDLPRTCLGRNSQEMLYMLEADDRLRVCFDTNHLLNEDVVDFVKNVGHKFVTTHVSDYDFIDERHWVPGEGGIDWNALYEAFKKADYKGVWLYELDTLDATEDLTKPGARIKGLTYEDLVRVTKEIFAGKPITGMQKRY